MKVMEKIAKAKTDKERANRYGLAGAAVTGAHSAAGTALGVGSEAGRRVLSSKGIDPKSFAKAGLKTTAVRAAGGYVGGRMIHRFMHGPARGKSLNEK